MFKIRKGLFETNSSSVHSLTMCSGDEFSKWTKGEIYYRYGEFYDKDKVIDYVLKYEDEFSKEELEKMDSDKFNEVIQTYNFETYKSFWEYDDYCAYEYFVDTYTTKSGEVVVAFGYYGENG